MARIARLLVTTLIVGLVNIAQPVNADTMVTKTITVKDSTGHLYAGAQVQTILLYRWRK
jgi:hypothetical protein